MSHNLYSFKECRAFIPKDVSQPGLSTMGSFILGMKTAETVMRSSQGMTREPLPSLVDRLITLLPAQFLYLQVNVFPYATDKYICGGISAILLISSSSSNLDPLPYHSLRRVTNAGFLFPSFLLYLFIPLLQGRLFFLCLFAYLLLSVRSHGFLLYSKTYNPQ